MKKNLRSQAGFSIVEILAVNGLLLLVAMAYLVLNTYSEKLTSLSLFKMDAIALSQSVFEILKDPKSCTGTLRSSASTPPSFVDPLELSRILSVKSTADGWTPTVYFKKDGIYGGQIQLTKMVIRNYNSAIDSTPGHKLEIEITSTHPDLKSKKLKRKFDLFLFPGPALNFPKYPISCSTLPKVSTTSELSLVTVSHLLCPEQGVPVDTIVKCPPHKKAVHCFYSIENVEKWDDQVACYASTEKGQCTFKRSRVNGSCEEITGTCECL